MRFRAGSITLLTLGALAVAGGGYIFFDSTSAIKDLREKEATNSRNLFIQTEIDRVDDELFLARQNVVTNYEHAFPFPWRAEEAVLDAIETLDSIDMPDMSELGGILEAIPEKEEGSEVENIFDYNGEYITVGTFAPERESLQTASAKLAQYIVDVTTALRAVNKNLAAAYSALDHAPGYPNPVDAAYHLNEAGAIANLWDFDSAIYQEIDILLADFQEELAVENHEDGFLDDSLYQPVADSIDTIRAHVAEFAEKHPATPNPDYSEQIGNESTKAYGGVAMAAIGAVLALAGLYVAWKDDRNNPGGPAEQETPAAGTPPEQ